MSEWALCVRAIACPRKSCQIKTGITETAGHECVGLQYGGVARCFWCSREWDYSRLEGGQAKVKRKSKEVTI